MKKNILYIVGGIIIILLVVWASYSFTANSGEAHANTAVELFTDEKFEESLTEVLEANRKGYSTTTLSIMHGQILAELGRYEEARAQYELVKTEDASAIPAVDELLKEIAGL